MALAEIIGQNHIIEQLVGVLKHQRVAHAYIFSGPEGVGKKKMALEFAKALNCLCFEKDNCGMCVNCIKINNMNHPDVIWIGPEGKSIKIDQIRQLHKDINFIPYGVKHKVFIIQQAELLTQQAANSLLKFLEEPEERIVAILLVDNYNQLLTTIKSRCQIINFSHLDPYNIAKLMGDDVEITNDLLIAAHMTSDIDDIKKYYKSDEFAKLKNLMIQWVEEILYKKYEALNTINKIVSMDEIKEDSQKFLKLLLLWYKDLINIKLGRNEHIVFKDYLSNLSKQSLILSEKKILDYIEEIIKIEKKISSNVNFQISLENLILSFWEGK
ncbi:MAG: DNA polymerase III subunit delta' [Vulcanibacillus sp.]